jgi:hypothetical protein
MDGGPTPSGLKVTHVQFSALQEVHIVQVLEADLKALPIGDRAPMARLMYKATAGVARLVTYAVRFLKSNRSKWNFDGFVDYLLPVEYRKDVEGCYRHQRPVRF